ncbi:MAG: DUF5655 domain-containing protein, partial [Rubrivivax sp.]|nr:DUF5655 domain-containing protein [Rubrivivax sp.]
VRQLIQASGLAKHGEIRSLLMERLQLGYGDANTLTHVALASDGQSAAEAAGASPDQVLDTIYSAKKAALRPIHDALMAAIEGFGSFEIAPKKGYVSLRRKKQFAMIGPATNDRVELGLNMKGVAGGERLLEQAAGGMCSHKVKLTDAAQVDAELLAWVRQAFDGAG